MEPEHVTKIKQTENIIKLVRKIHWSEKIHPRIHFLDTQVLREGNTEHHILSIEIGRWTYQEVFRARYTLFYEDNSISHMVDVFRPGKWVKVLEESVAKKLEREKETPIEFQPIDDERIFR